MIVLITRLLDEGCTIEKSQNGWYHVTLPDGNGYGRPSLELTVALAVAHLEES